MNRPLDFTPRLAKPYLRAGQENKPAGPIHPSFLYAAGGLCSTAERRSPIADR